MGTHIIEIPVQTLRREALSAEEKRWMDAAVEAAERAYAPYSSFRVGAVATLTDGTLVAGNNQENAAYPSGLCAERVALFAAAARYPDSPVQALTLVAIRDGTIQPEIAPCGACRQVLLETERRFRHPVRLLLCGNDEIRIVASASALLPMAFG